MILVVVAFALFADSNVVESSANSKFKIEILSLCGNNIAESGEECDGTDLGGNSCVGKGFSGGSISCNVGCTLNTSMCTTTSGGGGGGGGGGGAGLGGVTNQVSVLGSTVIFEGWAYPSGLVTILKNGQEEKTVRADKNAVFSTTVEGVSGGEYVFSIYGQDARALRSGLFTVPVTLALETSVRVSEVFVAPTISLDKSEVKRGNDLKVEGYSVPNGLVEIFVNDSPYRFAFTNTDSNGFYSVSLDTTVLPEHDYVAKVRTLVGSRQSTFSRFVHFKVGNKDVLNLPLEDYFLKGDLNDDDRVNLVDFSIASFWIKKDLPDELVLKETNHLNGDGKIDLVDFSIMAHHWTG